MNLNLKQLEAFVWVADLGSFRKAADRLNTTQPNISSRIASLEAILNVTLMERDAGSVRLTSKGQELLLHARKVLRTTEDLVEASDRAALYDGVLKLGVTELIVHTWLRDFLKVLKVRFPNVLVELTVDLSINLVKDLFARSIDLAFQNGPFDRQVSGSRDLGSYPLIWVASPSIGLHDRERVSLEELAQHPILTHARDTRPYEQVVAHFGTRRNLPARLVPSNNLSACLHMTVDGMGIATLPAATVSGHLATGELVQIGYDWVPDNLDFMARYDADRSPQFVAKAAEIAGDIASDFTANFAVSVSARMVAGG